MRSRCHHDRLDRGAAHLAAGDGGHHRRDPAGETTASPSWPAASSSPSAADQSSLGFPRVLDGKQRRRAVAARPGLLPRARRQRLLPPGPELHARRAQPGRHPGDDRPDDLRRGLDIHGAPPGEHHRAGEGREYGRLRRHGLARGLRVRPLRAARARRRDERSPQPVARTRSIAEPEGHGRERAPAEGVRRADDPCRGAARDRHELGRRAKKSCARL